MALVSCSDGGEVSAPINPDDQQVCDTQDCQACADDTECAQSEVCIESKCQPGCRSDAECGAGSVCADFVCQRGCRDPADCGLGETCVGGQCVEQECETDSECGSGARCRMKVCEEVGDSACTSDEDCGLQWHCSQATGRCIDTPCAGHSDCAADQWCLESLCEDRDQHIGPFQLVRQHLPGPSEHLWSKAEVDFNPIGSGGGLADIDGDLDLDLFLGAHVEESDTSPCLFRNTSEAGRWSFEAVEGLCDASLGKVNSSWGIDLEGDGYDELLLLGRRLIKLVRFVPDFEIIDLMDLLPDGGNEKLCVGGAAVAQDIDGDGLIDVIIGCQLPSDPSEQLSQSVFPNILFRQRSPGQLTFEKDAFQSAMDDGGNTLFLGILDVDDDGLADILVGNDSYLGQQPLASESPGGILRNCPPDEACVSELHSFTEDQPKGAYMGVGNIDIDGEGEHIYITDFMANRLLSLSSAESRTQRAGFYGVELAYENDEPLFSWSVLVDDFDRNGLDDFLVTQGHTGMDNELQAVSGAVFETHQNVIFMQRAGGDFTPLSDEVGLLRHSTLDSTTEERVYSSRSAVKTDLNSDGALDIIIAGLEGHPIFYSEEPQGVGLPRCTLVPRNTVVPSYGWGYAVSSERGARWRRRDLQGQMRLGASPWVLSDLNSGRFRFPSGAVVSFDCGGGPGPVEIFEPDWIQAEAAEGVLLVSLDAPWLNTNPIVKVALHVKATEVSPLVILTRQDDQNQWRAEIPPDTEKIMLKIGSRWVDRWLPL